MSPSTIDARRVVSAPAFRLPCFRRRVQGPGIGVFPVVNIARPCVCSTRILVRMGRFSTRVKYLLKVAGPGIITGAADDDPSGIATYTQTGAQFGYGQLWTALLVLPLLIAVQEACARIGAVTGKGISAVVKEYYSKKVLYSMLVLVVVANTINLGADLGAM